MFLIGFLVFLFGLCMGSFLNVVIYRYNSGRGLDGRSHCMSCGKTLEWYELIPVFSFIFQQGKCASCKSRISWQYPIVEFLTGALFLGTVERYGLTLFSVYACVVWMLLMVIFVYDLKHKIIPDGIVYAFMILSFASSLWLFIEGVSWVPTLLSGPVVALPFILIWAISMGRWMGFGDAKLALGIGWFLGVSGGYTAVILAFWIGALVGLILIFSNAGKVGMKSELPFAPFLIIGIAIVFFANLHFGDLLNFFSLIRLQ